MPADRNDLPQLARRVFTQTLASLDAGAAVRRAVTPGADTLKIFDSEFDARDGRLEVYAVALGKAAGAMAVALDEILGERLRGGVLSAPPLRARMPARWRVFEGGHPLPNAASIEAARAAFDLLRRADERAAARGDGGGARTLVIFLVSGGGSAMMELPRDPRVTLEELVEMNHALVTCGARIGEINAVRRALSAVKGGGLSRAAPRAEQLTLLVSDVGDNEGRAVASGPTFSFDEGRDALDARAVVGDYDLAARLPASFLSAIAQPPRGRAMKASAVSPRTAKSGADAPRRHFVLLDNARAVGRAAEIARALGFEVETAHDLSEQHVEEGARLLVSRLFKLRGSVGAGRGVCVVSGGEFACPVRGEGRGGRNSETVLRCAIELDSRTRELDQLSPASSDGRPRFVLLSAGTDGIDGNSPAAGALCDETTVRRARALGLDPHDYLERSDAYAFFDALGDAITTGATGTNVRDLRILMAK